MTISDLAKPDGPLVAWRCTLTPAHVRYAEIVRELTVSAVAVSQNRSRHPAGAIFSIMASLGGEWRNASADTRDALIKAYERLGLKLAHATLRRGPKTSAPATASDNTRRDLLERYLAPFPEIYELDDAYDSGVSQLQAGEWRSAIRKLCRACRGFQRTGGLYELHAADCLLNLSMAAVRLENLDQALAWAGSAQLLYERWGRLPEVAKAMLNRIGLFYLRDAYRIAGRLAEDCETVALRARVPSAADDARVIRLAIEARVKPHPNLMPQIDRLHRRYGEACDPLRKAAYQRCRDSVRKQLDLAVARQTVTLILRHGVRKGIPPDFDPLQKVLQRQPEAALVLLETSFLELSAKSWPVLAKATQCASAWLRTGTVKFGPGASGGATKTEFQIAKPEGTQAESFPVEGAEKWLAERMDQLGRALAIWSDDETPTDQQLRLLRPTHLRCRTPGQTSPDAARRLVALADRWGDAWLDDIQELTALGEILADAATDFQGHCQSPVALLLAEAAEQCCPGVFTKRLLRAGTRRDDSILRLARSWGRRKPRGMFPKPGTQVADVPCSIARARLPSGDV